VTVTVVPTRSSNQRRRSRRTCSAPRCARPRGPSRFLAELLVVNPASKIRSRSWARMPRPLVAHVMCSAWPSRSTPIRTGAGGRRWDRRRCGSGFTSMSYKRWGRPAGKPCSTAAPSSRGMRRSLSTRLSRVIQERTTRTTSNRSDRARVPCPVLDRPQEGDGAVDVLHDLTQLVEQSRAPVGGDVAQRPIAYHRELQPRAAPRERVAGLVRMTTEARPAPQRINLGLRCLRCRLPPVEQPRHSRSTPAVRAAGGCAARARRGAVRGAAAGRCDHPGHVVALAGADQRPPCRMGTFQRRSVESRSTLA